MTGELVFDKLLRIDGKFNGKLISKGDLIVGPTGVLTGNVLDMGEVSVTLINSY
jgi:cytoskeletal protein CcmA (bactofilin family)